MELAEAESQLDFSSALLALVFLPSVLLLRVAKLLYADLYLSLLSREPHRQSLYFSFF